MSRVEIQWLVCNRVSVHQGYHSLAIQFSYISLNSNSHVTLMEVMRNVVRDKVTTVIHLQLAYPDAIEDAVHVSQRSVSESYVLEVLQA